LIVHCKAAGSLPAAEEMDKSSEATVSAGALFDESVNVD
jgi:hypothetical protein